MQISCNSENRVGESGRGVETQEPRVKRGELELEAEDLSLGGPNPRGRSCLLPSAESCVENVLYSTHYFSMCQCGQCGDSGFGVLYHVC